MTSQLWVEPVGSIIIARIRGMPNEKILQECQERILAIVNKTGQGRVLHDTLEMEIPPIEVPLSQWKLDEQSDGPRLRRAVVVRDTKMAYLARLAFGENCRVFYNDMAAAFAWLEEDGELTTAYSSPS